MSTLVHSCSLLVSIFVPSCGIRAFVTRTQIQPCLPSRSKFPGVPVLLSIRHSARSTFQLVSWQLVARFLRLTSAIASPGTLLQVAYSLGLPRANLFSFRIAAHARVQFIDLLVELSSWNQSWCSRSYGVKRLGVIPPFQSYLCTQNFILSYASKVDFLWATNSFNIQHAPIHQHDFVPGKNPFHPYRISVNRYLLLGHSC